jgi:hydrogenase maturation protein HypF
LRCVVRGVVQGVGFRPFVYQLAAARRLVGWVNNSTQGVVIEVEGPRTTLDDFLERLETDKPTGSFIQSLEASWLDAVGYREFEIRPSDPAGEKTAFVRPDIATCPECVREIFDPADRRFGYPFTNCTHCGPRFSILESLPYDRPNTSMKRFTMCDACRAEYENPRDRRFHAQPNACPDCGPHVELWNAAGRAVGRERAAMAGAVEALRQEAIVAVKGLGGFHLMVVAHSDAAVRRLRERKHREEKPLALMFPSFEAIQAACEVSAAEARLLRSPEAPIVLLSRRDPFRDPQSAFRVSEAVAPGNPYLGAMLPYTPLHHLLLAQLQVPVVATSGNRSDEPICVDEREAVDRLRGIADLFLVHNRPIVRHVDDSIVRVVVSRELVLRRARGFAPWPLRLPVAGPDAAGAAAAPTVLAVGAHLKNTVALAVGPHVFLSQHIGDLETTEAFNAFRRVAADLPRLYETRPEVIAADAHPDYLSTRFAQDAGRPVVSVQHHYAHVLACMAENELEGPVLGVSWDGTGFGLDGTIWGGEFLRPTAVGFERVARLRPFRLPGGDAAVKEPRRSALGLLCELFGEEAFSMTDLVPLQAFPAGELNTLRTMLRQRVNSPLTSSAGRLFDAVASLAGLRQRMAFEGQAAMELEFAATQVQSEAAYPVSLRRQESDPKTRRKPYAPAWTVDWAPMIQGVLADTRVRTPLADISAKFHRALGEAIVLVARAAGQERVVLTGGCFQNRVLLEETVRRLREGGFRPYWHQRVPPNDGGIALGQAVAARRTAVGRGNLEPQQHPA